LRIIGTELLFFGNQLILSLSSQFIALTVIGTELLFFGNQLILSLSSQFIALTLRFLSKMWRVICHGSVLKLAHWY